MLRLLREAAKEPLTIRLDLEQEGIVGFYEVSLARAGGEGGVCRVVSESARWQGSYAIKEGKWDADQRLENVQLPATADALLLQTLSDARFQGLKEFVLGIEVYNPAPALLRQRFSRGGPALMPGRGQQWATALEKVLKSDSAGVFVVALHRITGDIVDVEVQPAAGELVIRCKHRSPDGKERWAYADQESDGTLRSAALLTALLQKPSPTLIALEEPELAIHPGALEVIYDFIRSAQKHTQVIVTTHSPELLDNFEADLVRVVDRSGTDTRITPMDEDQRTAVRDALVMTGRSSPTAQHHSEQFSPNRE